MCGICGFIGNPLNINRKAMLDSLRHRGPDDTGEYEESIPHGVIWFGHKRFSILTLTTESHQPMHKFDGRLTIIFDGEIYNILEIKKDLERCGHVFVTHSDTEVILDAWHRWGSASLSRFRGMFAFAIWDRRELCLWLARDRMGEKPLYFTIQKNRFIFSSEIRSILASGIIERRIDSDGLDSYLTFGSVSQPYTIVKNVKCLDAGYYLRFKNDTIQLQSYWSLKNIDEQSTNNSREKIVQEVGECLRESEKMCMVSDVPVGILLSGGVDSTTNLALLNQAGYKNLSTFTVTFEGEDAAYSEEYWSDKVVQHFQSNHTKIPVQKKNALKLIPEAIDSMDQPSIDGCQTYIVCKAIANEGFKVAITGLGSDEIFLGYGSKNYYKNLIKLAKLPLPYGIVRFLNNYFSNYLFYSFFPRISDRIKKLLNLYGIGDRHILAYISYHSIFNNQEINKLRGIKTPSPSRFVQAVGGTTSLDILSRLELSHYAKNSDLRDTDQMSMANSLELRSPFLDCRLVELVVSQPINYKLDSGRYKPLLVDSLKSDIINEISMQPKTGFELPLKNWLRDGLELGNPLNVAIGLEKKEIANVIKRSKIGKNYTKYWSLLILSNWFKKMRMLPAEG